MQSVLIKNLSNTGAPQISAEYCASFISRLKGLMFQKSIEIDSGVLLVEKSESVLNTSIHMFFMAFDIAVIWIDSQGIVVDMTLAQRWRPYYAPRSPARYTLETHPSQLKLFHTGDRLEIVNPKN